MSDLSISNAVLAHLFGPQTPTSDPDSTTIHKDERSRVSLFLGWLALREQPIDEHLLVDYRHYLQTERHLQPSSLRAHLASIRGWLRPQLRDDIQRFVYAMQISHDSEANNNALNNIYHQLWKAIDPQVAPVQRPKSSAAQGFCPTLPQIQALFDRLSVATLPQLRDTVILATLVVLGLRQTEVCALDAEDILWTQFDGAILHIPDGAGSTARDVKLFAFPEVSALIRQWMREANVRGGPVLRGFHRNSVVRPQRLSRRSVERVLAAYPITVDGEIHVLKPLELRRFAARLLVQKGFSLEMMRVHLGVSQVSTVIDYLGGDLPKYTPEDEQNLRDLEATLMRKLI